MYCLLVIFKSQFGYSVAIGDLHDTSELEVSYGRKQHVIVNIFIIIWLKIEF